MDWLVAQVTTTTEFGWLTPVAQLGSTGVALVMAYWFIKHLDKKDAECREHTKAIVAAHKEYVERKDKEGHDFIKSLSDSCHDVHKESTAAVRECTRTLGRALSVLEGMPPRRPQPSDSQIRRDNDEFEKTTQ